MQIQSSVSGWQEHVTAGKQYLRTARRGVSRPAIFNNELIFQLAAMAIEKLAAGLSHFYGRMPEDETLSGLVMGLDNINPIDGALIRRIQKIGVVENICSLSVDQHPPPSKPDVDEILAVGQEIERYVESQIASNGRLDASKPEKRDNHESHMGKNI